MFVFFANKIFGYIYVNLLFVLVLYRVVIFVKFITAENFPAGNNHIDSLWTCLFQHNYTGLLKKKLLYYICREEYVVD